MLAQHDAPSVPVCRSWFGASCLRKRSEDPVDDPVVEEEAGPSTRTASYAQDHCGPPRPYSGHGFGGPQQLTRSTFDPRTYEESHYRGGADPELPAKLLRSDFAPEENLYDWRNRRRDRRCLRRHGHQRDRRISEKEQLLLLDRHSPPRP